MTAPSFDDTRAARLLPSTSPTSPTLAHPVAVEFLRYFIASALALAVDFSVYAIGLKLGLDWALAAAFGFCCGLWLAYTLSIRFAFRHRIVPDRRLEFLIFFAVGLAGLALTELILWLLIERQQFAPFFSKLAAAGLVFLFNFTLRKLMLFRRQVALMPNATKRDE